MCHCVGANSSKFDELEYDAVGRMCRASSEKQRSNIAATLFSEDLSTPARLDLFCRAAIMKENTVAEMILHGGLEPFTGDGIDARDELINLLTSTDFAGLPAYHTGWYVIRRYLTSSGVAPYDVPRIIVTSQDGVSVEYDELSFDRNVTSLVDVLATEHGGMAIQRHLLSPYSAIMPHKLKSLCFIQGIMTSDSEVATFERHVTSIKRDFMSNKRESICSDQAVVTSDHEVASPEGDVTSIKRDSGSSERDVMSIKRDSASSEHDVMSKKRNSVSSERDVMSNKRDSVSSKHDVMSNKRDLASSKRDSASYKRDSVFSRRGSISSKRDSVFSERDVMSKKRDSVSSKRDVMSYKRYSVFSRRCSISSKRDSVFFKHDVTPPERATTSIEHISVTGIWNRFVVVRIPLDFGKAFELRILRKMTPRDVCGLDVPPRLQLLLYDVVRQSDVRSAAFLLKYGGDVNVRLGAQTLLHLAAERGSVEMVQLLLDHGADANVSGNGGTPLHLAAKKGHETVAELLIDHGMSLTFLESVDSYRMTPLHYLAATGCERAVEILLKIGVRANPVSLKKVTPLHLAKERGNMQVADFLIKYGALLDLHDVVDMTLEECVNQVPSICCFNKEIVQCAN